METEIDFHKIPVSALQLRTTEELSSRLNEKKVLCAPDKRSLRDYRGLADCMDLKPRWSPDNDHVKSLLHRWSERSLEEANFGRLIEFLERIDRFDVLEDICDWLDDDARTFLKSQNSHNQLTVWQSPEVSSGDNFIPTNEIIFDAFVLYVDADFEFAQMILHSMKAEGLRVCDKNRDLLPGENEFVAVNRLIEHRCRTLLVIFSVELIQDQSCMQAFNYACSLSNQSNAFLKRVIPCVYKECILPSYVLSLVRLDFSRYDKNEFLCKLRWSITSATDSCCLGAHSSLHEISFPSYWRALQGTPREELEHFTISEVSESESNDSNRAPREPKPSRRKRPFSFVISFFSLFTPKRIRKRNTA